MSDRALTARPSAALTARRPRSFAASLVAGSLACLLVGCGSEDTQDDPGPDAAGFACAKPTDSYHAGLTKLGARNHFRITLLDADPAPPARYDNRWTVAVENAASAPVLGATLRVSPDMPEHGHGALRPVVVTELGDGRYQLDSIYLHMPGYWEVPIEVDAGGEVDEASFTSCILP